MEILYQSGNNTSWNIICLNRKHDQDYFADQWKDVLVRTRVKQTYWEKHSSENFVMYGDQHSKSSFIGGGGGLNGDQ